MLAMILYNRKCSESTRFGKAKFPLKRKLKWINGSTFSNHFIELIKNVRKLNYNDLPIETYAENTSIYYFYEQRDFRNFRNI